MTVMIGIAVVGVIVTLVPCRGTGPKTATIAEMTTAKLITAMILLQLVLTARTNFARVSALLPLPTAALPSTDEPIDIMDMAPR